MNFNGMRKNVTLVLFFFPFVIAAVSMACMAQSLLAPETKEPGKTTITMTASITATQVVASSKVTSTIQPVDSPYPIPDSGVPTSLQPTQTSGPYPGPESAAPTSVAVAPTSSGPYPGPEITPTKISSPTGVTGATITAAITPTPVNSNPYPGPGTVLPSATATPVIVSTPSVTPLPSITNTSDAGSRPTPSATVPFIPTITPVSSATLVINQSPTPVLAPTSTPTATPSPTPTPTATWTPVPPPPWIGSDLRASDPSTVELASGRVQFIWFFAFWDGPSQAMASMIHGLEAEYNGQMNFIYLDIDDPANQVFKDHLGYRSQPHFFLLDRQGTVLQQWSGYVTAGSLIDAFNGALY